MTEYLYPNSIEEALDLLHSGSGQTRIIAGGTDVLPDIRKGKITPKNLIDITRIPGLDQIEIMEDHVKVGAAVTFAEIKDHHYLQEHVHVLVEAARSVGTPAIQHAATWAGNIVQAMPAADGAIAALTLEAEAYLVDNQGGKWHNVEDLFRGPGVSTVDPSQQIISHLRFPLPKTPWGTGWQRIGRRPSLVLPILNCAVKLVLDSECKSITKARIALGPIASVPTRAVRAEAALAGQKPTRENFMLAAQIAKEDSHPRSSINRASRAYRLTIIPTLVSQALMIAANHVQTQNPT